MIPPHRLREFIPPAHATLEGRAEQGPVSRSVRRSRTDPEPLGHVVQPASPRYDYAGSLKELHVVPGISAFILPYGTHRLDTRGARASCSRSPSARKYALATPNFLAVRYAGGLAQSISARWPSHSELSAQPAD